MTGSAHRPPSIARVSTAELHRRTALALALGALIAAPQNGEAAWSERAPLPEARQEVAVAELGGQVYVLGGFRSDGSVANTVEIYDPDGDTWTMSAPLPVGLHHAAAASVGGRLYVIGGFTDFLFSPVDSVFEYDPDANTWTAKAQMPTARGSIGIGVLNGLIYAVGGSPLARERDLAVYDPGTDTWTVLPDMPTPRNHLAAGIIDGRFYAAGGRSGGIGGITPALEEYDPESTTWSARAPMPTARGGVGGAVVGGRLFVFGGEGNIADPSGTFSENEAYDATTDSWTSETPMTTPRHGIGAAVVGGFIYVPGGATTQGFGVTDSHEVFDASFSPTLSGKRLVVADRLGDATRRKVIVLSKDEAIQTPAAGSTDDPRTSGAVLRLLNPATTEMAEFVLPPGSWEALGKNPEAKNGYRYLDRAFSRGPCKVVIVKPGKLLRATCISKVQPIGFNLDEPTQGQLDVTFQFGSAELQCMAFGGTILKDRGVGEVGSGLGLFKAKDAAPPAACPSP